MSTKTGTPVASSKDSIPGKAIACLLHGKLG